MIKKIKLWFVNLFICFRKYRTIWIVRNPSRYYLLEDNVDKLIFLMDLRRDLIINK